MNKEKWYADFRMACTAPLDDQMVKIWMIMTLAETQGEEFPGELEKHSGYRIVAGRFPELGKHVAATLACQANSPGEAVMLASYASHCGVTNMTSLANAFPMGFPSRDALYRLWDEQKRPDGANAMDAGWEP